MMNHIILNTFAHLYSTRIQNLNDVIHTIIYLLRTSKGPWAPVAPYFFVLQDVHVYEYDVHVRGWCLEVGAGVLVLLVAVVRAVVRQLSLCGRFRASLVRARCIWRQIFIVNLILFYYFT